MRENLNNSYSAGNHNYSHGDFRNTAGYADICDLTKVSMASLN